MGGFSTVGHSRSVVSLACVWDRVAHAWLEWRLTQTHEAITSHSARGGGPSSASGGGPSAGAGGGLALVWISCARLVAVSEATSISVDQSKFCSVSILLTTAVSYTHLTLPTILLV